MAKSVRIDRLWTTHGSQPPLDTEDLGASRREVISSDGSDWPGLSRKAASVNRAIPEVKNLGRGQGRWDREGRISVSGGIEKEQIVSQCQMTQRRTKEQSTPPELKREARGLITGLNISFPSLPYLRYLHGLFWWWPRSTSADRTRLQCSLRSQQNIHNIQDKYMQNPL